MSQTTYVVLIGQTGTELRKQVQARIDTGWKPLGGVSVCHHTGSDSSLVYAQAMTYEQDEYVPIGT